MTTPASVVYVVGAVARPGLYRLAPGARVNDAVERAGGLRADADPAAVNLAERVSDGEEIHVLRLGETARAPARKSRTKRKTSDASAPIEAIDLNAAGASALASNPGIGATLAARIVAYRRLNGPFASLDELADVAGMTPRRIDALAPYVTVIAH
jgi:competence protein ComEA